MNLSSTLNLVSETPLQKVQYRKMKTVLNFLLDHNDSVQFHHPVDWQGLQLFDYLNIVKTPMDLGTVNKKFQSQQYHFIEEVLDDIQLIWDNCKNYNQSNSWIWGVADKMDKYYKKLVKNYFTNVAFTQNQKAQPSGQEMNEQVLATKASRFSARKIEKNQNNFFEEDDDSVYEQEMNRTKIVSALKKLNSDKMGKIVEIILDNCPKAYRQVEGDRYQIYFNQIEQKMFHSIKDKLQQLNEGQDRLNKRIKTT